MEILVAIISTNLMLLILLLLLLIYLTRRDRAERFALPGGGQLPAGYLWEILRTHTQLGNHLKLIGGLN